MQENITFVGFLLFAPEFVAFSAVVLVIRGLQQLIVITGIAVQNVEDQQNQKLIEVNGTNVDEFLLSLHHPRKLQQNIASNYATSVIFTQV